MEKCIFSLSYIYVHVGIHGATVKNTLFEDDEQDWQSYKFSDVITKLN